MELQKPYIKKIESIEGFDVWIVDGKYIRGNLEPEFTNFAHPLLFKCIPEKEFWIDKDHDPSEEKYFIEHMLFEYRLMSEGMDKSAAITKANLAEKRERAKVEQIQNSKDYVKENYNEIIRKVHKEIIEEYSNIVKVWVVNGTEVRNFFFIDFTQGGHDKVYKFVPPNEIWIDDDVSKNERKYIILHEIHERNLMSKGMIYEEAHIDSTKIELFCRHNPKQLDEKIKEELIKSLL